MGNKEGGTKKQRSERKIKLRQLKTNNEIAKNKEREREREIEKEPLSLK